MPSPPGSEPGSGRATPYRATPQPGGQNRFAIEATDLARNDIVTGVGAKQIIARDPSGNPVELFGPILPKARL